MIIKIKFVLFAALLSFSGLLFAGVDSSFSYSGTLDSSESKHGFDSRDFNLGSHLDGIYKITFDVETLGMSPSFSGALATISDDKHHLAGAFASDHPLADNLPSPATFLFDATHGTDYFASIFGVGNPMNYNLHIALVPELETWVMMAAGMGLLGWRFRNKKNA